MVSPAEILAAVQREIRDNNQYDPGCSCGMCRSLTTRLKEAQADVDAEKSTRTHEPLSPDMARRGTRLAQLRRAVGWSQREVANKYRTKKGLCISDSRVGELEKGEVDLDVPWTKTQLTQIFGANSLIQAGVYLPSALPPLPQYREECDCEQCQDAKVAIEDPAPNERTIDESSPVELWKEVAQSLANQLLSLLYDTAQPGVGKYLLTTPQLLERERMNAEDRLAGRV